MNATLTSNFHINVYVQTKSDTTEKRRDYLKKQIAFEPETLNIQHKTYNSPEIQKKRERERQRERERDRQTEKKEESDFTLRLARSKG